MKNKIKSKNRTKTNINNKKQYRGTKVTKQYIIDFIQREILDNMSEDDKKEKCLEYDFLPDHIRIGFDNIKNMLVQLNNKSSTLTGDQRKQFESYNNWVKESFFKDVKDLDLIKSNTHIRKIQTGSDAYFESPIHREFNNRDTKFMYNVICYYSNENCNLENCGLGIIYKDKDNQYRKVVLPVINGLTLKIRDKCFFHFTPELMSINTNKPVTRILIRTYYTIEKKIYENNTFNNKILRKIINENNTQRDIKKKQKELIKTKRNLEQKKLNNILEKTMNLRDI
jgi:hypothetical protein